MSIMLCKLQFASSGLITLVHTIVMCPPNPIYFWYLIATRQVQYAQVCTCVMGVSTNLMQMISQHLQVWPAVSAKRLLRQIQPCQHMPVKQPSIDHVTCFSESHMHAFQATCHVSCNWDYASALTSQCLLTDLNPIQALSKAPQSYCWGYSHLGPGVSLTYFFLNLNSDTSKCCIHCCNY